MFLSLLTAQLLSTPAFATEDTVPVSGLVTYSLVPKMGDLTLVLKFDRDSLAAKLAHDHIVTPSSYSGKVTYDPTDLAQCSVSIEFPVTALVIDPSGSREKHSLPDQTSDGDKEKITDNMLHSGQLNGAKFKSISFASTSCEAKGSDVYVSGHLTIHGVTRNVGAQMKMYADGSTFSAHGSFNATHADFGMTPYSAMMGALKNDTALHFEVNVTGSAE